MKILILVVLAFFVWGPPAGIFHQHHCGAHHGHHFVVCQGA